MNERLQQFLSAENITQAQFADSIGVARASVSHILAGRNKPGYDFILNMLKRYPELNAEWLLTGQGKMYKSAAASSSRPLQRRQADLFDSLPDIFGQQQDTPAVPDSEAEPSRQDTAAIPPRESRIAVQEPALHADIAATERDGARAGTTEHPVKQRNAARIIIFYDDGTFQEFGK